MQQRIRIPAPRARLLALFGAAVLVFIAGCEGEPTPTLPDADVTASATADNTPGRTVKAGDTVAVHYRGTLDDGTEFDSSKGRDPLSFRVGSGDVIPGFDDAVMGLNVGDKNKKRIEPARAYGAPRPDLVVTAPASQAPPGLKLGDRVKRYMKHAGIDAPGSCHLLRHACATHMLENGAELRYLQAMLGHADLRSTQLYTHVSIRKLAEIHALTHPAKLTGREPRDLGDLT